MVDILLIEDNLELAKLTEALLLKKGFSLWHVVSGEGSPGLVRSTYSSCFTT